MSNEPKPDNEIQMYRDRMVTEFMNTARRMAPFDKFSEDDFRQLELEVDALVSRVSSDLIIHFAHLSLKLN